MTFGVNGSEIPKATEHFGTNKILKKRPCRTDVKNSAFNRKELLEQDIRFKMKFYYTKNASYETSHIGTIRLVPDADAIKDLSVDFDHMKDMIYGEKPSFEEIIDSIAKLEDEINAL